MRYMAVELLATSKKLNVIVCQFRASHGHVLCLRNRDLTENKDAGELTTSFIDNNLHGSQSLTLHPTFPIIHSIYSYAGRREELEEPLANVTTTTDREARPRRGSFQSLGRSGPEVYTRE